MQDHECVDKDADQIHAVVIITASNVHVLAQAEELLYGDYEVIYGDAGYQGIAKRPVPAGNSEEFQIAM
jgi:IS5 family transposase